MAHFDGVAVVIVATEGARRAVASVGSLPFALAAGSTLPITASWRN